MTPTARLLSKLAETERLRKKNEGQIKKMSGFIRELACRIRFLENAPKLTTGPR